mmetsp:Transcript_19377/g.73259  ORF Transcript_19377/g.73259 Transcript_19377/m.73259 type:complete len:271 (-) Transcript_19377:981-1793(-)
MPPREDRGHASRCARHGRTDRQHPRGSGGERSVRRGVPGPRRVRQRGAGRGRRAAVHPRDADHRGLHARPARRQRVHGRRDRPRAARCAHGREADARVERSCGWRGRGGGRAEHAPRVLRDEHRDARADGDRRVLRGAPCHPSGAERQRRPGRDRARGAPPRVSPHRAIQPRTGAAEVLGSRSDRGQHPRQLGGRRRGAGHLEDQVPPFRSGGGDHHPSHRRHDQAGEEAGPGRGREENGRWHDARHVNQGLSFPWCFAAQVVDDMVMTW